MLFPYNTNFVSVKNRILSTPALNILWLQTCLQQKKRDPKFVKIKKVLININRFVLDEFSKSLVLVKLFHLFR